MDPIRLGHSPVKAAGPCPVLIEGYLVVGTVFAVVSDCDTEDEREPIAQGTGLTARAPEARENSGPNPSLWRPGG
jgi:hypothetical protein